MTQERSLVRRLLRLTPRRMAIFIALAASVCLYQMYFTPEKRLVRQRLSQTDAKSQAAIDARLKPLAKLFAKGRKGAKEFAQEALSLQGKWEMLKGFVQGSEYHRAYLSLLFERTVFSSDELREAMESAVAGYLGDVEGFESEMLVQLRADLADPERIHQPLPESLRGTHAFREECRNSPGR